MLSLVSHQYGLSDWCRHCAQSSGEVGPESVGEHIPEVGPEQLEHLEMKLEELHGQKHKLFLLLKHVWHNRHQCHIHIQGTEWRWTNQEKAERKWQEEQKRLLMQQQHPTTVNEVPAVNEVPPTRQLEQSQPQYDTMIQAPQLMMGRPQMMHGTTLYRRLFQNIPCYHPKVLNCFWWMESLFCFSWWNLHFHHNTTSIITYYNSHSLPHGATTNWK